jgi:hypothetical protein
LGSCLGPATAAHRARARLLAVLEIAEHAIALALGYERPDLGRGIHRVADLLAATNAPSPSTISL